ncbi:hypothetical protein D3C80_898220 [compost metagenome]
MRQSRSVGDVASSLNFQSFSIPVGKLAWVLVSILNLHFGVIQRTAIDSWRCSRLHSSGFKSHCDQILRNSGSAFLTNSTSPKLLFTQMNQSVQECSIRQNNRLTIY